MKSPTLLFLLLLATPLVAQKKPSPTEAPPAATTESLPPNQQAFLNLPEETRKDFIQHYNEANRLFQQKRIFESLDEVEKADAIFKDSSEVYNLRGSCYVEMRAFDKALVDFDKAAALSQNNTSIGFNIGEVYFVTKQWQKSMDAFEKILKLLPPESVALARLVEFKILLCKIKLNQRDQVAALAQKYDFLDDSPYYYYANAALAYDKKDLVVADEWLGRAARIFRDPNILAPWQDTLVEFGYIKSFYGEDKNTDE